MHGIKILLIVTSHATMGDTSEPTGVWFEELATPYYAFTDAGAAVEIASVRGGKIPIDPRSLAAGGGNPRDVDRFLDDAEARRKIEHSLRVDGLSVTAYSVVFLPGGHGTMWDLPTSQPVADLLSKAWAEGKVIGAVCHGPVGLVNVKDTSGRPLVAGKRVSAFSDAEERAAGLDEKVPFLLEARLRALGARYESGPNFEPFALCDGRLVTGQNPASSEQVARLAIQAIHTVAQPKAP